MPIKAVVWDIDDTIFDYAGADTAGLRAHLVAEGTLGRYGDAERALAIWKEITDRHWARFGAGGIDFVDQRRDRVRDFVGDRLGDAEADAWFERYFAHYQGAWRLFPDAVPALDALADGFRHAVLSNSSLAPQRRKLRALGVLGRFETVLCAAELGVSKPAAEAFLAVCDALALSPAEVAYVGDQPETDARGARDAGLTGIWLDRGSSEVAAPAGVRRIATLAELPGVLDGNTRFGAPSTFG
ncbi:HAD family hydrolase [Streptomyces tsukubensis]|uniref:Hydrolase n=1 Tax=Streptomyces tsukubensis TaxID=83656 RepID=A0A1V3ZZ93_9ACTN|nr:HAD family hydrolase [Streptomyces tsukubensis]OON71525.1 hydrolase [Streptomyces tsukubensis]QFR95927.1 HAD-IA family hydrolase [Streptomyces tsukubensis]